MSNQCAVSYEMRIFYVIYFRKITICNCWHKKCIFFQIFKIKFCILQLLMFLIFQQTLELFIFCVNVFIISYTVGWVIITLKVNGLWCLYIIVFPGHHHDRLSKGYYMDLDTWTPVFFIRNILVSLRES